MKNTLRALRAQKDVTKVQVKKSSKNPRGGQCTSDYKQLDERLFVSEQMFYKLFDASPGSISISKPGDGTFIYVNQSFLYFTVYSRPEEVGQSVPGLKFWAVVDDRTRFFRSASERRGLRLESYLLNQGGREAHRAGSGVRLRVVRHQPVSDKRPNSVVG